MRQRTRITLTLPAAGPTRSQIFLSPPGPPENSDGLDTAAAVAAAAPVCTADAAAACLPGPLSRMLARGAALALRPGPPAVPDTRPRGAAALSSSAATTILHSAGVEVVAGPAAAAAAAAAAGNSAAAAAASPGGWMRLEVPGPLLAALRSV